ncbi:MAG: hypothetical protein GEU74_16680, partial [Nitriliruptorales bacterium]|nr:hypothetical protein [Nitriliruptorales bacterium]
MTGVAPMDRSVLASKQLTELKGIASHLQMRGYQRLKKAELIDAIVRAAEGGAVNGSDAGSGSGEQLGLAPSNGDGGETRAVDARAAGVPADGDDSRSRVRTRMRERTQDQRGDEPRQAAHDGQHEQRAR